MLYVVATPIGNLNDITLRALEILKSVDLIAAEDTRHSGNLLRHFEIRKPLVSYHEHNEAMRSQELAERLAEGKNIAIHCRQGIGRAAAETISASCTVVRIGRDRTMALAILRDLLSSPNS